MYEPSEVRTVELPASEVVMHMRMVGEVVEAETVGAAEIMVDLYRQTVRDGLAAREGPFCYSITRGEAGYDHPECVRAIHVEGYSPLAIHSDYRDNVARAVESEHPCSDEACDIAAAQAIGEPIIAAWLLVGATETPLLSSVLDVHRIDMSRHPHELEGWSAWKAHHDEHGHECEACGAFTYGDEHYRPETCGNCLAALPALT